jgi:hypothetical protein
MISLVGSMKTITCNQFYAAAKTMMNEAFCVLVATTAGIIYKRNIRVI